MVNLVQMIALAEKLIDVTAYAIGGSKGCKKKGLRKHDEEGDPGKRPTKKKKKKKGKDVKRLQDERERKPLG